MIETVTNLARSQKQSYCMQRIADEFAYAAMLSDGLKHRYDELINEAEQAFEEKVRATDGVVTPQIMHETEEMLAPLAAEAKSYTILCAGHAHIDMNWQWGFQGTVDLTVDTVGTVLSILDRYPEFRFSQSQASVYKILEDYRPDLLERVKRYVHEGRWEVTAATWVEHDKNMPSGESQARQLLYAKRYVSQLLDIPMDDRTRMMPSMGLSFLSPAMLPKMIPNTMASNRARRPSCMDVANDSTMMVLTAQC